MPFFLTKSARDQFLRNQREAQRLVHTYGEGAVDVVQSRIDTSENDARSQDHWKRVLSHLDRTVSS